MVVYEDEHCLAVIKAAGQFVQGNWAPPGEQTLEQEVRSHLRPDAPGEAYVGIVHRLDRPVSGILIWAKNQRAARRLSGQFERRTVEKEYWAITDRPREAVPAEGRWIDWLTGAGVAGVVNVLEPGAAGSREAITRYRIETSIVFPFAPESQWVRLWPETGRTHQLRVQTAKHGMPIAGDANYGSAREFPRGIALHARSIRVRHPVLQTPLLLNAPLPKAWWSEGYRLPEERET
jgi:23S rRNA pseudouridine1911/1915/1917 synthase